MTVIQCDFLIFRVNLNRDMDKFSRGTFFLKYRWCFLFWTVTTAQQPTHRRQHWRNQQHNEDNTYDPILTHAHTTKHKQTQTNTNTSPISSTGRPTSFRVARGLHSCMIRTSSAKQGMSQSTRTLTLWQVSAVCKKREPTGRVFIVIVAERGERDDKSGKREEKERRERERRKRERTPRAVFPLVVALAVYAHGDSTSAVLGQGDMARCFCLMFFIRQRR